MPYPDLLDPAYGSRPALGRPFPVFGTVLLALAIVGAGLLFVPPTRLVGLLLVLPVGGAVLYVWFRNREQTNGVLTVTGLAVLAVTLGVGVAMTIAARTAPAAAGIPPDPSTADPSTAAQPGSTVGYVGTVVGPTLGPAPKIELTPAAPLPVDRTAHRFETAKPRKTTEPTPTPDSDASAQPSSTPTADDSPDSRNDSDSRNSPDSRKDTDSRNDTDSESARANADRNNDYCSVGQYKINNNGTADVCAGDQDDQGHYIWRRNVPPPDDDR
jgi:hypothetical protein